MAQSHQTSRQREGSTYTLWILALARWDFYVKYSVSYINSYQQRCVQICIGVTSTADISITSAATNNVGMVRYLISENLNWKPTLCAPIYLVENKNKLGRKTQHIYFNTFHGFRKGT